MNPDRAWIAAHIPHQGSMCLLEAVQHWNPTEIVCQARSHCREDNPLRFAGRLGISAGIEYAAQAMAVHGALLATEDAAPCVGFLTSVRDVRWSRSRLDDVAADLTVCAERLSGNAVSLLYQFSVRAAEVILLSGRASVLLQAPKA